MKVKKKIISIFFAFFVLRGVLKVQLFPPETGEFPALAGQPRARRWVELLPRYSHIVMEIFSEAPSAISASVTCGGVAKGRVV